MKFKHQGKYISRKALEEKLGKEKVAERIRAAKEKWADDPYTLMKWLDGMTILDDLQE